MKVTFSTNFLTETTGKLFNYLDISSQKSRENLKRKREKEMNKNLMTILKTMFLSTETRKNSNQLPCQSPKSKSFTGSPALKTSTKNTPNKIPFISSSQSTIPYSTETGSSTPKGISFPWNYKTTDYRSMMKWEDVPGSRLEN